MEKSFAGVLEDIKPIIPALYDMIERAHEKTVMLLEKNEFKRDPWYFSHTMRKYMENYFNSLTEEQRLNAYPDMRVLNMTGISLHFKQYHIKIRKSKIPVDDEDNIVPTPSSERQKRFYSQEDIRDDETGSLQLVFEDLDPEVADAFESDDNDDLKGNLIILYDLDKTYDMNGDLKIALPIDDEETNSRTVPCHWIEGLPRYSFASANEAEKYDVNLRSEDIKEKKN